MVITSYIFAVHSSCKPSKCMQLKAFVHFELLSANHAQMVQEASVQRETGTDFISISHSWEVTVTSIKAAIQCVSHESQGLFLSLLFTQWPEKRKPRDLVSQSHALPSYAHSCQFSNHSLYNATYQHSPTTHSTFLLICSDLGYYGIILKSRSRVCLTDELCRMTA